MRVRMSSSTQPILEQMEGQLKIQKMSMYD